MVAERFTNIGYQSSNELQPTCALQLGLLQLLAAYAHEYAKVALLVMLPLIFSSIDTCMNVARIAYS